ncbi:protein phosphatase 2c, putative [Ichthyophthirius multifiliis]|uniref:protein-serine/threonine phosphatase n=1 Tax=Ichthyophthirius multifiliis TaxID=5932 RepID=G0R1Y1_ICHMU|nr:protein phosphatase 2c, putative [Ichthyophthirius multifiliis]EGR28506.1 protein phosphatase 2c, putative [Ichthyophthirius multifiliis]|eukprot:XP_004029742.1 protein phosphatase 2c, putative [Ichthyophthirius multifiliis]
MKPSQQSQNQNLNQDNQWPKCSFFGVFDGHGGISCSDFLRDNLHQFIIKDSNFPLNPTQAIFNGFKEAENQFITQAQQNKEGKIDKSGSCAIIVLILGKKCYIANVGDSRAIMSACGGSKIFELSRDHKPQDEIEEKRIIEAGGQIYQTKIINNNQTQNDQSQQIYGPYRVYPGRLSVTRTFGDIEAKLKQYGGNPKVVIATPDIKEFEIEEDFDFIMISSDGIFDRLSSVECIQSIWSQVYDKSMNNFKNSHEFCGNGVDLVMKHSLAKQTMDNITTVIIGFDNLKKKLFPNKKKQSSNQNKPQSLN